MSGMLPTEIPASALSRMIALDWGEVAWSRADALQIVASLEGSRVAILGGDVLQKRGGRFEHESSNWHSDRRENEDWAEYAIRSRKETVTYLERFPDREDGSFANVMVFKSRS